MTPQLLGGVKQEMVTMESEFIDSPSTKKGTRQLRPWFIGVCAALLCTGSFFIGKWVNLPSTQWDRSDVIASLDDLPAIPAHPQRVQMANYPSRVDDWCNHEKSFCSSIITDKPTDTLNALTASIPQGNARSYQIRVSIVPLDCDDSSAFGFGPPCSLEPPITSEKQRDE